MRPALPLESSSIELGDAGQLPATAQPTVGVGSLDEITGAIPAGTDADIFRINITNPATFSATTAVNPGTLGDTTLYLFTSTGVGLAKHENINGMGNELSNLPAGNGLYANLPAGEYLLVIAPFNYVPAHNFPARVQDDFMFNVSDVVPVGPKAAAVGQAVEGWFGGSTDSGTYRVTLTGTSPTLVPEPGSLALLVIAAAAVLRRHPR